MKKELLVSLLVSFLLFPSHVWALVSPTEEFYVNDYANILSTETENYIVSKSQNLEKQTGAQIVVVTVENLEGEDLESYATALFREFGIGDEEEDNGLLLLLALEERESRVEVGYGLEGILPDGKTGRFQDQYMIPYFKDDNFDEGMLNGYKAFYQELANYYQITDLDEGDAPVEKEETTLGGGIIFFQIIFILFMISKPTLKNLLP